jgi:tetratricopeptide (TPR) repeat protein
MLPRTQSSIFSISHGLASGFLLSLALLGGAAAEEPRPVDSQALLRACEQAESCSSHLEKADQMYKQGRFSAAIEEYQAAYTLQPYPPILYNIARLHHKQNHLTEAVTYYQRYLDAPSDAAITARVKQQLFEAQSALALQTSEPAPAPLAAVAPATLSASGPSRPTPALTATASAKEHLGSLPIYKKWWFWTVLGVAVSATAAATGVAIGSTRPDVTGLPAQTFSFGR